MEDKLKSTMSLLDGHLTPNYSSRLYNKRYNFKKYMYRKRLTYGILSQAGIVNETLRTLPWIFQDERNQKEILSSISTPTSDNINEDNQSELNKLIYDSEFNLTFRQSKREMRLRQMLEERVKLLTNTINNN
jgi:hypothetical protein